jgi:VWFA-related protein
VLVTDADERSVTDLGEDDFQIFEDGKPRAIEQFKVVRIARDADVDPPPIRTHGDEEREAARDDVRMFALFLTDAIRCPDAQRVREALERFVRTHLYPSDLLAVVQRNTLGEFMFTRDHEAVIGTLRRFGNPLDGFVGPGRSSGVEQYVMRGGACKARGGGVRALQELAVKLSNLRDGRKAIVYVGGSLGGPELTLPFYELITTLNRTNTAVYVVDTGGLTVGSNFARSINLRAIAEATGGMAIVNTNNYGANLKLVAQDATFYYLLGYTSPAANDGKFHKIDVRVKRQNVTLRSRAGFLALSPEPAPSPFPKPLPVAASVTAALASVDPVLAKSRYVETWAGVQPSGGGTARVTLSWDLLPAGNEPRRQPKYLSVVAFNRANLILFSRPDDETAVPIEVDGLRRAVSFETPPGLVRLRVAIADGEGAVLDEETRTLDVPDYAAARPAIGTPQVFRARNAREFRLIAEDPSAPPAATRAFSRTEQLIVRFDRVDTVTARAALLNSLGQPMKELPVGQGPDAATRQLELNLNSLAPGQYLIEITATRDGVDERALVPFRVRG